MEGRALKLVTWLNKKFEKYATAILFILFTSIMVINVSMRFIMNDSLSWASEAVLTIFVWFVWFGISYGFKEQKHIKITFITNLLPKRAQKILKILVEILILVFFIIAFTSGVRLLNHFSVIGKTSLLINYPMWLFYLSAPVGIILSIFRIIQNAYHDYIEYKNKLRKK